MSALEEYILLCKNGQEIEPRKGELRFKHHIFPRSLYPCLKNKEWNITYLTYSEHRRAHQLLARITTGKCRDIMQGDLRYFV